MLLATTSLPRRMYQSSSRRAILLRTILTPKAIHSALPPSPPARAARLPPTRATTAIPTAPTRSHRLMISSVPPISSTRSRTRRATRQWHSSISTSPAPIPRMRHPLLLRTTGSRPNLIRLLPFMPTISLATTLILKGI